MKYQFQVNGVARAPVRDTHAEAINDAVKAGYAYWDGIGPTLRLIKIPDMEITRVE